ncbi:3-hydroxyacyl-ACP dehydratase FabZ [Paenibacillus sp. GCM10012307]|uniref:3-hydroxyacyl-[acyl-carrier-protein] dehydratase n=1 Tax=Paenibacillus roseus TaxID=2798579 RepID=A0A934MXE7_9BACL|nr:3-hydroxyacyl-ACP dehydratase FabZ [Paenibacillus roseus]MBJ6364107.1 3-hydroxyacyl-ACP dehydratase FabZ [Paenibacillus roseus]
MESIEIEKGLPHRHPFIMVDRILEVEYMKRSKGYKNVSINEQWAVGHFPDEPLYPGVLMIETMAQVGGFIFYKAGIPPASKFYLGAVKNIKFIHPVKPGDTFMVETELIESLHIYHQIKCTATVGDKLVATGVLTLVNPNQL